MTQENLELADTFYRSLTGGDIAEPERLFMPDAVVRHNFP